MTDSQTDIQADDAGAMLRETADRLLADRLTPQARAKTAAGEWPEDLWAALDEVGLPAAILPEAAGGFGVPVADALSLLTVAGSHALPLPLADTMLAGFVLARAGIEVPAGPLAVAQGSDVRVDAAGLVSGHAWGVSFGRHARAVVVLAEGPGGPVLVAVPRHALTVEPGADIAGDPSDAVRFEGVAAPSAPASFGAAGLRAVGAATRALMMAGALGAVSAMTAGYARERRQFGRAIGQFQAVQQNLAVLAGQAASAAAAAGLAAEAVAAWAAAPGPGLLPAVAAAKVRTGEAAGQGTAIAHQIHGAIGFTAEHRLHLYTGRLRAWRDAFGREAEWAQALGRHLVAAGPDGLWPAITAV
ncbi:acyl-CoA/acyl-ACP dehydrogenase (plasmid) [Methylobacterium currus]|uniref:acyl-CoA dehydrogenase family protein n=1 Tax=Methylobacterium currus TaxID=2051553 RepID=UPI001E29987D|nr:acyl-CoA dehydrogenase family protein [Methylobacterium currus]UHC20109.1 acyl-CoA/acyl-ACP dehydrogenase [Methylobacterium currus]